MLPLVLVLLFATGAFAAPSVTVDLVPIEETAFEYDTGSGVSGTLIENLLLLKDNAELNIYILTLLQELIELATLRDSEAQAIALGTTIAVLDDLAYAYPGDACAAADAIRSYVQGRGGRSFLTKIINGLYTIKRLVTDPASLRKARGPVGNCAGGGRSYPLEAAWNSIISNASPQSVPRLSEVYCSVKRLATAINQRSNNVGASATAAALPDVVASVRRVLPALLRFLRQICYGKGKADDVQVIAQALAAA